MRAVFPRDLLMPIADRCALTIVRLIDNASLTATFSSAREIVMNDIMQWLNRIDRRWLSWGATAVIGVVVHWLSPGTFISQTERPTI